MDIKQLFIQTKKTVLNWAIVISTLYFGLALLPILANPSSKASWFSGIIYGVIFALFIRVRLKKESRMVLFAIAAFGIDLLYNLIVFFTKLPNFIQKTKEIQAQSGVTSFVLLFGVIIGYGLVFLTGLFYYQAYKATVLINQVNQEAVEVEVVEVKSPLID